MVAIDEHQSLLELDAKTLQAMQLTARSAAVLVIAIALGALIGWTFNIEFLRSVSIGLAAMNPGGTAISSLVSGVALLILTWKERGVRLTRVAQVMAIAVITLTSVRLGLYAVGIEWGPDQWLFPAKLNLYSPPNRMAFNTAIGFLLTGIALLVIDVETHRGSRPSEWIALAAALVSLFTLVGYAYHASILFGIRVSLPMALNAAATLGLLATGILCARPDRGMMAIISNRESGGQMARRFLPAAIIAPAAFAWLASPNKEEGLFEPTFGISLFVVSTIVLFSSLIWWNASLLNRMDSQRNRTQKELQQKGAILTSVLNSMGDGVVVADRQGRFLMFNPAAEHILGLGATNGPPSEWGTQYGIYSAETAQPVEVDEIPLVRAIRGESTEHEDLLIRNAVRPEGVTISISGRPLRGDEGIEGGVVVFQDTTQRRRAAEQLRQAHDEADAANRAKSDFLANMSHEIRTPMNAVIGMTELVLESELSDVQQRYLKVVKDSGESLLSLINDILDFSKIEAGKLELDHTAFQLRDMLGDAMKTLSVRARGKDLELAYRVAPDVPDFLVGDPYRLRQVVTNLVGNAVKFTQRGEVILEVVPERLDDNQARIHISVRDTGIGIPTEKQHLLFGAFSQLDASTTRRYGGTGLGLAITARLVPLMNGRVWVESEVGKGSTFHFTAQFERDHSPPRLPASPEALKDMRVLIVDDNATNRLILQEMFTVWGMRPLSVASANMALDELRCAIEKGDPFQVVLTDTRMPEVDGFELTSRIRQDHRFGGPVIMMLSSDAGSDHVARCDELGVAAHLTKPIKSSELFSTIAAVMGTLAGEDKPPAAVVVSGWTLKILLAEDSEANQLLALGVLGKWGHSITVANNGLEAVSAFERGQFDVILMDVQMPEMDGFQATGRIRAIERERGGHIPIIAMTAHAMKGDRDECLSAGMDDYVTKPIDWSELRGVIDRALLSTEEIVERRELPPKRSSAESTTTEVSSAVGIDSVPQTPLPEPPAWTLDWGEALRAVDGDTDLLRKVMEMLLWEWPGQLVELNRAATDGDAISLRRAAHTIGGNLRFLGFTDVAKLADQVEHHGRSANLSAAAGLMPTLQAQVGGILNEVKRSLKSSAH